MDELLESVKAFNELHGNKYVSLKYHLERYKFCIEFSMDFQNHKQNSIIDKLYGTNCTLILEYFVRANHSILLNLFKIYNTIDTIEINFPFFINIHGNKGYNDHISIIISYLKTNEIIIKEFNKTFIKKIK